MSLTSELVLLSYYRFQISTPAGKFQFQPPLPIAVDSLHYFNHIDSGVWPIYVTKGITYMLFLMTIASTLHLAPLPMTAHPNPPLLKPRRKAIPLPLSPDVSSDESEEPYDFFYRIARAKNPLVCPFSDMSRDEPCIEFSITVERKEFLMKHLLAIKNKGGNAQHPIDDGLWDDDFTKYLMMPRPGKYSVGKRKRSHQKAAKRAYQKKKRRETEMGQVYRQRFDRDELSATEYRKILTGANKRRFDEEQRVKERVEAMQAANDQILQQRLQQKIAELQSSNALGVQDARIQKLEYLRQENYFVTFRP